MSDMEKILMILGCISGVCIVYYVFAVLKGNKICNTLANMLVEGRYEDFDRLAGSQQAKRYAKPFTLNFLKLNSAIARSDDQRVKEMLSSFEKEKLNPMQWSAVYNRVFYYYVAKGKRSEAKAVYERMLDQNIMMDERMKYVYDAYCEDGFAYIDELEKLLPTLKEEEKTEYYALLADMYKNKKDLKTAEKYRNLVEQRMQRSQDR